MGLCNSTSEGRTARLPASTRAAQLAVEGGSGPRTTHVEKQSRGTARPKGTAESEPKLMLSAKSIVSETPNEKTGCEATPGPIGTLAVCVSSEYNTHVGHRKGRSPMLSWRDPKRGRCRLCASGQRL
jgi:hypothetical protein